MKNFIFIVLFLLTSGLAVGPATAQEGGPTPSPDEVNKIAKNLYCPVCANVPLDVCDTAACAQWRQQIADLLTAGYTEQQIYDYFVQQYGEAVLAAPRPRGLNILIYVLPFIALLIGAALLWRTLLSARKSSPVDSVDSRVGKQYVQQLEDELKTRK